MCIIIMTGTIEMTELELNLEFMLHMHFLPFQIHAEIWPSERSNKVQFKVCKLGYKYLRIHIL